MGVQGLGFGVWTRTAALKTCTACKKGQTAVPSVFRTLMGFVKHSKQNQFGWPFALPFVVLGCFGFRAMELSVLGV